MQYPEPELIFAESRCLVGMAKKMTLASLSIPQLWADFGPRRKELDLTIGSDSYSVAVYDTSHFADFKPHHEFERWAAVEVEAQQLVPTGMKKLELPGGWYAVFHYRGMSTDSSIFNYIYGTWLKESGHALDDRPHFEVLGKNYRNNDPTSEEDIWIPIQKR